jgi:large subunit ribosomal protein L28
MSKRDELTGVGPLYGNSVSHSKKTTRRRWEPNLKYKRVYLPEEGRWVRLRISASTIKTLTRKGMASVKKMAARVARQG